MVLDVVMTALYVLLMFGYQAGAMFHEVSGIVIFLLFALHLFWNQGMLRGKIRQRSQKAAVIGLAFDGILTVGMLLTTVTGILISQVLLTLTWNQTVYLLHNAAAWVTLFAMAGHLLLHLRYLAAVLRRWQMRRGTVPILTRIGALAAAVCLLYLITLTPTRSFPSVESSLSLPAEDAQQQTSSSKNGQDTQSSDTGSASTPDAISLEDYLRTLTCTACGRHCLLSNPQCGRAQAQIQSAEAAYQDLYGSI